MHGRLDRVPGHGRRGSGDNSKVNRPGRRSALGFALLACAALAFAAPSAWATQGRVLLNGIDVRDVHGTVTQTLSPADTFFVDVSVTDTSGFRNVTNLEFALADGSASSMGLPTWQGARFGWQRGAVPAWSVLTSNSAGWRILPELCAVDTLSNAATAQKIRFAISPCSVARVDGNNWVLQAWLGSVTLKTSGYAMAERIIWVPVDPQGAFAAGSPGATGLPLSTPSSAQLAWRLVTNTDVQLEGRSRAFAGLTVPSARFGGGAADTTLGWTCRDLSGTTAGHLDSTWSKMGKPLTALADTAALLVRLVPRLAIPAGQAAQAYATTLELRATGNAAPTGGTIPLTATVLGSGIAAHAAEAEVEPHRVTAGGAGVVMLARLGFTVGLGETGVNRIRVALPKGWGAPHVTGVSLSGVPVAFHDASTSGSAVAVTTLQQLIGPLRVDFTADAPSVADSLGSDFITYFDDTTTASPEQVATAGDPDHTGASGWTVAVDPAPATSLVLLPATGEKLVGDTLVFTTTILDAYGNRRFDPVTWSAAGGAGGIDGSGRFIATAAGSAIVIARAGALADTAFVHVTDPSATVQVAMPTVPATALVPGAAPVEIARLTVTNPSAFADTLDTIVLADVSRGLMTDKQREASWSAIDLRGSTGLRLATGIPSNQQVTFDRLAFPLPAGATRTFSVFAAASLDARDGDSLGVDAASGAALVLRSGRPATRTDAPANRAFAVDGMSAAQVALRSVTGTLFAGAHRRWLATLHVPANGYAPDQLLRLNLLDLGTAVAGTDVERLEAWADDGNGVLDTLADARIGALAFTGDRWELTGLAVNVPAGGRDVFLTADVASGAQDGNTVQLALPGPPDVGLGMASGDSGPIDGAVKSDRAAVIGGGERVLVTFADGPGGTVWAGERDVALGDVVLTNGYADTRHLRALTLTNTSWGTGGAAHFDGAIARLVLAPLLTATGPAAAAPAPVAIGSFSAGRVTFSGLDLAIPAGAQLRLHVTADLDAAVASDGDHLQAAVASASDVEFLETTLVGGTWPAKPANAPTIDGLVAAQVALHPVAGLTLAPSDGPVVALDLTVPSDGDRADVLRGVRVANLGTAAPAEIASLHLYRDGGDGQFGGPTADDTDLGALVPLAGQWQSAYLSEAVPVGGRRYYVALTVAPATSDSSLVQLAVPIGGLELESANDGPLDVAIANPEAHVLSTRPLLASLVLDPVSSTIGQDVDVVMSVRNVGNETVNAVAPGALVPEGSAAWQKLSGPTPASADLAPGASATFTWTVRSVTAGTLRFAATALGTGATSSLERRALVAHSSPHEVFTEADSLRLVAQQSMPSSVNLGQTGVVPLTLTLEHPGDASSSDIVFRRLRVRLEDESGAPVVPASLASAIEVREGTALYLRRTNLETSGDVIDLPLATPVTLTPGSSVSLALRLDVAASTSVPSFRLAIDDSSVFVADDAISARPVKVRLQDASYPVRSGLARLLAGGGALVLGAPAPVLRHASTGQLAVPLAQWTITHSSTQATSADLRLNSLIVRPGLPGAAAAPAPWTRWRVVANGLTIGQHDATGADTGDVAITLAPAPIVQPGVPVTLRLEADLGAQGAGRRFAFAAVRTSQWDVRDVNTGDPAPVQVAAPVLGDTIAVEAPATGLAASPLARMPATVAAGRMQLPVLDLVLANPAPAGTAGVRVDSVRTALQAPDGHVLAFESWLGAIRLSRRGVVLDAKPNPSGTEMRLAAGITIAPGASDTLRIEVDVAPNASSGSFELRVGDHGVPARDVNTGTAVDVVPAPPAAWPFGSGSATVVSPARELRVHARSELPALLPPAGTSIVPAAALVLRHPGPLGTGPIAVDHVVVSACTGDGGPLALGDVAAGTEIRIGDVVVAAHAALAASATTDTLVFTPAIEVAPGDSAVLRLGFRPRAGTTPARFRVGWASDGIGVVQPASALLAIAVLPDPGASFPMWTEVAGFSAGTFAASVLNYPNPFAAGREPTTIAYLLPSPGRVTLRIWTPAGQRVATLLEDASLPAGLRESDRWDGRNGRGDVVLNGVYVAEIDVRFDDGRHERVLRKVAVVR